MRVKPTIFLAVLALSFALSGCDSYNLLDQFRRSLAVQLAVQQDSLEQGETTELYPSGGTPPYMFGIIAGNIYTNTGTLGSVASQTYTAGTAIGTVSIHVVDSAGETADATVTLIPPAPQNLSGAYTSTPSKVVNLSWTYSFSGITNFVIQRSLDGVTFSDIATVGSGTVAYGDTGIQPNKTYYYRVLALEGPIRSRTSSIIYVSTV